VWLLVARPSAFDTSTHFEKWHRLRRQLLLLLLLVTPAAEEA
jgi:hypothetical protein